MPWEKGETVEDCKGALNYKQGSDKTAKQKSYSVWEKSYSEEDVQRPRVENQVYLPGSATNKVSGQKQVTETWLLLLWNEVEQDEL